MDLSITKASGSKISPQYNLEEGKIQRKHVSGKKKRNEMRIGTCNVRTLLNGGKRQNYKTDDEKSPAYTGKDELRWTGHGGERNIEW